MSVKAALDEITLIFIHARSTGKKIKYSDLLKRGYSTLLIDTICTEFRALKVCDQEGYTLIALRKEDNHDTYANC